MKKHLKKIAVLAGAAAIALSTAACSSSSATVVNYKDGKITQDEYYEVVLLAYIFLLIQFYYISEWFLCEF